jgi:hypothetical protein
VSHIVEETSFKLVVEKKVICCDHSLEHSFDNVAILPDVTFIEKIIDNTVTLVIRLLDTKIKLNPSSDPTKISQCDIRFAVLDTPSSH